MAAGRNGDSALSFAEITTVPQAIPAATSAVCEAHVRGAVNPSGWSGVIEVKSPAGVTAGYLLLYTNP